MRNSVVGKTRPDSWLQDAATLLLSIWSPHDDGYVFVGTRRANSTRWTEHALKLPVSHAELVSLFQQYHRNSYDIYFCANAFGEPKRRKSAALPTIYACVDVDEADLASFQPEPTLAWETSPGRSQGIWEFDEKLSVGHAEKIARNLAYNFGADKNGWSITKYLRVPYTYNHKPAYKRPMVRLIANFDDLGAVPLPTPTFQEEPKKQRNTDRSLTRDRIARRLPKGRKFRHKIHAKYASRLPLMPRSMLGHDTVLFPDRSVAIYAIVAGLHGADASRREIEIALWNSPYFLAKHGSDRFALEIELTRILENLEYPHDDA